jgi:hypothetical protein
VCGSMHGTGVPTILAASFVCVRVRLGSVYVHFPFVTFHAGAGAAQSHSGAPRLRAPAGLRVPGRLPHDLSCVSNSRSPVNYAYRTAIRHADARDTLSAPPLLCVHAASITPSRICDSIVH